MVSNGIAPELDLEVNRPSQPFDGVAADYDTTFTRTRLGRWYREMVWRQLAEVFLEGDHVLELGCGTGEDAVWLAGRGVSVTATDASARMLEVARYKAREAGVEGAISLGQLDLNRFSTMDIDREFDGVLANFGPMNCVANRVQLAERLGDVIRPGGYLVLIVMGPLCPWEIAWHTIRLEFGTAFRRLRSGRLAFMPGNRSIPVWYPSIRRLERECGTYFQTVDRAGLGLLLPPTGMGRLVERMPRLFRIPAILDRRLARRAPWRWLNDHYLLVMERRMPA